MAGLQTIKIQIPSDEFVRDKIQSILLGFKRKTFFQNIW